MACLNLANFTAPLIINDAYNTLVPLGVQAFQQTQNLTQQLANFALEPIAVSVTFDDPNPPGGQNRPERPDFPEAHLALRSPGAPPDPPTFQSGTVALETPPEFSAAPPPMVYGVKPSPLTERAPGPAPTMPERDMPVEPDYVLPDLPVLEAILVPPPPDVNIAPFTEAAPEVSTLPEILETWHFSPEQYASALLDKIKGTISDGLDGGIGLPAAVQDALWAQVRDRVDLEESRAVQQAVDEYAARGFTEPSGILNRRIEAARQAAMNQRLESSRTLVIEEAKLRIENIRFMVQQGIALEGALMQYHMQYQQLELQGQQFLLDAAIRVFDAKVSQIRLAFEVFVAKAQVYKTQIEAELAKVEIYRAEVEAAKLRGEINEQLVRRYEAQIRAVNTMAEFYNSRVRAFTAQIDADKSRIEAFRSEVQAYGELVGAKTAEWQGYRASVEAEAAKAGVYDTAARAYATRVGAVNERNRITIERERLNIQQHEAQLRTHAALLQNISAELAAEQARVQSVASAFDAQARVFAADAQVEQSLSAAKDRRYGLEIEKSRAAAQIGVQNSQAAVQENISLNGLRLQALQVATQVLAQLSASALSAVNASVSSSVGTTATSSCSDNYQY